MAGIGRAGILAALLLALLAGCASGPGKPRISGRPGIDRFEVAGRIAVRYEGDGYTGSMRWQHANARDAVELFTPVGTLYARLKRDENGATMDMADGKHYADADASKLSERVLGWEIPLDALSYWILTRPAPGEPPRRVDVDAEGRPALIEQAGWRVRYQNYAGGAATMLPGRIDLDRPGVVVKLLVSRWAEPAPGTP